MLKDQEQKLKQPFALSSNISEEIDTECSPSPRAGHSLCTLTSKCYLFGGASHEQGLLNDIYSYDFDTKLWKELHPKSSKVPCKRYEHSCAIVGDKLLIMFGASDQGPTNDFWEYNIGTNEFNELSPKGTVPSPRVLKSVGLVSNRIYVFGGGLLNSQPVDDTSMYCLDYNSLFWFKLTGANVITPKKRLGHTLTAVGKYLYLFGGIDGDVIFNDLWRFDTIGNKWEELSVHGQVPEGRCAHAAVEIDNVLYIIGGMSTITEGPDADNLTILEEMTEQGDDLTYQVQSAQDEQSNTNFNTKNDQSSFEPKQKARTIKQPKVFDSVFTINLKTLEWSRNDNTDSKRLDHSAVRVDDKIFVFGGMDFGHVYDTGFFLTPIQLYE